MGNIISDSDKSSIGKNVAEQTYHSVAISGGLAISETRKFCYNRESNYGIYKPNNK